MLGAEITWEYFTIWFSFFVKGSYYAVPGWPLFKMTYICLSPAVWRSLFWVRKVWNIVVRRWQHGLLVYRSEMARASCLSRQLVRCISIVPVYPSICTVGFLHALDCRCESRLGCDWRRKESDVILQALKSLVILGSLHVGDSIGQLRN